ncbi:MAG: hypothetical protein WHV44_11465 [Anaerolineales bacterium]
MRKFLPVVLILLSALACSLPFEIFTPPPLATPQPPLGATSTPQLATPLPGPTPPPATNIPALTFAQVSNMEVYAPVFERTVTLTDGQYQSGTDPLSADYLSVNLLNLYAQGDLDGDGAQDLVALLNENGGGTGQFVSLVIFLNRGGLPVQVTQTFIDDRPVINAISIAEGQIMLDAIVHGFEDPGCCPSFSVIQTYRLFDARLVLTGLVSRTPSGAERRITIETPRDGESVSSAVRLTGSVTIAPFENNLAAVIFDAQTGEQLGAFPCMVDAPDLGAPGTFDVVIPLDGVPAGRQIRIELQDQSMADGSLLAMDSVTLQVP